MLSGRKYQKRLLVSPARFPLVLVQRRHWYRKGCAAVHPLLNRKKLLQFQRCVARFHPPDEARVFTVRLEGSDEGICLARRGNEDEADAHVEGAVAFVFF